MKIEIHPNPAMAHITISEIKHDYVEDNVRDIRKALQELFDSPLYTYAPPAKDDPRPNKNRCVSWRPKFRICTILTTSLNSAEFTQHVLEAFNSFDRFVSAECLETLESDQLDGLRVCIDVVCVQPRRGDGSIDESVGKPYDPVADMEAALGA